jgi:hypothetical protein
MDEARQQHRLYCELADSYAERGQPQFRDRFLTLAADSALAAGDRDEAERCRQRLLAANPNHLLKPYASFAQAIQTPDVQTYVSDLRRNYPPDVAGSLKQSLQGTEEREAREIPVTAPLFNLDSGPDLLMSDENEPLKIFNLRDEHASGIPPTLPPEKLAAATGASPKRTIPQTLFDVEPPPALPAIARPVASRLKRAVPPPKPVAPAAPSPRMPMPVPPLAAPARPDPAAEGDYAGAWLPTLLFIAVTCAGIALVGYALLIPFFGGR